MSDLRDEVPNAKRPRTGDTIVDVHGLEASASAEQQTTEAAGPSQQSAAKEMFGMRKGLRRREQSVLR